MIAGDANIPRLGEITFFPRQLTQIEMSEIMNAGFSFESLATGNFGFKPESTAFDAAASMQTSFFADAEGERKAAARELQIENAFTRLVSQAVTNPVVDVSVAKIMVPVSVGCTQVPIFADKTSCHIMQNLSILSSDPATTGAKKFLDLIQPNYRPAGLSAKDRMKLDHNHKMEYLRYNATEFPSFCGKSATFSMWIENWDCGARSTLVARYPAGTGKRVPGSWFYQIDQDPAGTECCIGQIPASGSVAVWKCSVLPAKLYCMTPMTRRHLALVLNHEDNSIKFFLDGNLVETKSSELPTGEEWIVDGMGSGVGRLDCAMDTVTGYSALGHRVPGEQPYAGPVQDWRYYVGLALSAADIFTIATRSVDSQGISLRTCKGRTEGFDSNFKDIYGHDCAWYEENSATYPGICSSATVRRECPVACAAQLPCFSNGQAPRNTYAIWERQMPLKEYDMSLNTNGDSICVREGIDVVAECLELPANPQSFALIGTTDLSEKGDGRPGNGRYCNSPPAPTDGGGCINLKVWDCDVLKVAVNPSCSFGVKDSWTTRINAEIKANHGYTISFWWRAMKGTSWDSINKGQMLFFASMVPPRALFALDFYGNGAQIDYFIEAYDTCNQAQLENLNNIEGGQKFIVGEWYHVALVQGSPDPNGGEASLFVMSGSHPGTINAMKKNWCSYMPDGLEFIQGISVPGGMQTHTRTHTHTHARTCTHTRIRARTRTHTHAPPHT